MEHDSDAADQPVGAWFEVFEPAGGFEAIVSAQVDQICNEMKRRRDAHRPVHNTLIGEPLIGDRDPRPAR